jgi:glycosyltransferase involved in cell wall biosynthesis
MSNIKVSAVVLTYNQEKYIEQTIESIINQKVDFEFEIIIGEDHSTDNTLNLVNRYKTSYPDLIHIITSNENIGLLLNYRRCIKACQGEYIAVTGGDDYWQDSQKLTLQVDYLDQNPSCGMVYSDCIIRFESTNHQVLKSRLNKTLSKTKGSVYDILLTTNFITACTVCFRRDSFIKYVDLDSLIEQKFKMEDYPVWLELSKHTRIGYIDKPLATYRILADTVSRNKNAEKQFEYVKSIHRVRQHFISKYGCRKEIKVAIKKQHYKRILIIAATSGQVENASKAIKKLRKLDNNIFHQLKYLLYFFAAYNLIVRKVMSIVISKVYR